ncbi:hypothetical protein LTR95_017606 [Oleoguttula sp. CCFEE 5521]
MNGAKAATRVALGEVTNVTNGKETPAKRGKATKNVDKIDLTKTPGVFKTRPTPDAPTSNCSKKRSRPDNAAESQERPRRGQP